MKTCNYDWIKFLSGNNVLKITNEQEFNEFKTFLNECGLIEILNNDTEYSDWQNLAKINEKDENIFLFEYNNYKGITWWDSAKDAEDWYGEPPIEIDAIKEFFERKNEIKMVKNNEDIPYDFN